MRCPFCGHEDTQVKDSRPSEDGGAIRRRRFCANCGQRFTTIERTQLRELTVVKANSRRVPFDRDKMARSIRVALRKRPIQEERIERIVNGIVRQLEASGESDIPSKQIGELVMDTLKELDSVAYVRFASVYRNFREAKDFEDFIGSLGESPSPAMAEAPEDIAHMRSALALARRGVGNTWPNPSVGCVLVNGGTGECRTGGHRPRRTSARRASLLWRWLGLRRAVPPPMSRWNLAAMGMNHRAPMRCWQRGSLA